MGKLGDRDPNERLVELTNMMEDINEKLCRLENRIQIIVDHLVMRPPDKPLIKE